MNNESKSVVAESKVEETKELELEVRRSRKVRTGIKGGFRTQPDCGTWVDSQ